MIVAQGTTVLLTTQYLDEADQLADRIAVIDHGKVIAEGTRGELKASVGAGGVRVRLLDPDQRDTAERLLAASLGVPVHLDADRAELTAQLPAGDNGNDTVRIAATAVAELARSGIAVGDFALGQPSLDEVFLALTGSRTESTSHEAEAIA
jgi:ABC-2 type transport system ATP-binding protein